MTGKRNIWKLGFLVTGLCLLAILATIPMVTGQGTNSSRSYISSASGSSASTSSTTSSDRAYCVKLGGLYRTGLTINNGEGFCQFEGNSGCDARALANRSCGLSTIGSTIGSYSNPFGPYYLNYNAYPYYGAYPNYPNGLSYGGSSINYCRNNGGFVQRVHTTYGDVDQCIFQNGNVMAIYGHSNRSLDSWPYYNSSFRNPPLY